MQQGMPTEEAPEQPEGKALAYCVEVYVYQDGSYRVTKEAPEAEAAEHEMAGTKEGEGGQDFKSLGDALKGVLQIIQQNPVNSQDRFQAGFDEA